MSQTEWSSLSWVRRAVVLCAHTDDEFGCAGAIHRLTKRGVEMRYIAFSRCEESVPEGFDRDILALECGACTRTLGLTDAQVEIGHFKVRYFPNARQEILDRLYALNRSFAPDLVLLPTSFDQHQDHATVSQEGLRAFKQSTILGYELPQNNISFENSAFVSLSEGELSKKIEALASYRSQAFRTYAAPEYIRSLARVRGVQCGTDYAEAFEAVRVVFK